MILIKGGANYIKFKWFYEKVWKYLKFEFSVRNLREHWKVNSDL